MNYSLNKITSLADCNTLIDLANTENSELEFKKLQQERAYENVSTGSEGIDAEIAAVNSEITGVEMVLATMSDGPVKKEFESRLVKLNHKRFLLGERRERFGVIALLEKEYVLGNINQQLVESATYIAALNSRKADL
jgi:hypothetical protein